jgi:hypothetical protein
MGFIMKHYCGIIWVWTTVENSWISQWQCLEIPMWPWVKTLVPAILDLGMLIPQTMLVNQGFWSIPIRDPQVTMGFNTKMVWFGKFGGIPMTLGHLHRKWGSRLKEQSSKKFGFQGGHGSLPGRLHAGSNLFSGTSKMVPSQRASTEVGGRAVHECRSMDTSPSVTIYGVKRYSSQINKMFLRSMFSQPLQGGAPVR